MKNVELSIPFDARMLENDIESKTLRKSKERVRKAYTYIAQISNKFLKRCIDIVGALIGIIILLPLVIVITSINLISKDAGPLFFVQERIGKKGKSFKMYKFRSMKVGADEELKKLLAENPGKVYSRDVLLEQIWSYEYIGETRTVDVHIRHIRKKIEEDDSNPMFIKTVRGFGYKFRED